jgi:anti-sigma factor RsiW
VNHAYIDQHDVAGRYLRKLLDDGDRSAFEIHLVDCAECADRVLLAEMLEAEIDRPVPPPLPLRARWAAQRTPAELGWLAVLAVFVLLAIPATLFWWELNQLTLP